MAKNSHADFTILVIKKQGKPKQKEEWGLCEHCLPEGVTKCIQMYSQRLLQTSIYFLNIKVISIQNSLHTVLTCRYANLDSESTMLYVIR
ncbi:hypothetical protein GDO78_005861 [Eleutherodactylus coqui]|uniref:Uncharacterized protein n=1 Tax=Eleutherodactylus coqui TaxID=57060 RepID=A0A8J6FLV7_ELECQ|nr:hypothetical protein GDO78_005861 [Eleutherodactylus coqui]